MSSLLLRSLCSWYLLLLFTGNVLTVAAGTQQLIKVALKQKRKFTPSQPDIPERPTNSTEGRNLISDIISVNKQRIFLNHPLENYNNIQYTGTIYMGQDQQPFEVLFDTGSEWLWVPGKDAKQLKNKRMCTEKEFHSFNNTAELRSTNSSCELLPNPHEIYYGKGYVKGNVAKDFLSFSQEDLYNVTYQFLSVQEHRNLEGYQADGIFGLSFRDTQTDGIEDEYKSFLSILQSENMIEDKIFAFYLNDNNFRNENNPHLKQSVLTLGGYDTQYIEPGQEIEWLPVIDSHYWSVGLSDIFVDDIQLKINPTKALIDTGTSLIVMPQTSFAKFQEILKTNHGKICEEVESGHLVCNCPDGDISSYPTFQLGFINESGQTKNFKIKPKDYILKDRTMCEILMTYYDENDEDGVQRHLNELDQEEELLQEKKKNKGNSLENIQTEQWILGDLFIRKYYSIFDIDNKRIGLAKAIKQNEYFQFRKKGNLLMILGFFSFAVILGSIITLIINKSCLKNKGLSQQLNHFQETDLQSTQRLV